MSYKRTITPSNQALEKSNTNEMFDSKPPLNRKNSLRPAKNNQGQ